MILGKTVGERKRSLAELVKNHLIGMGKAAEIIHGRVNSAGHKDQVLIDSEIGLIHLTSTSSDDPNSSLVTGGFKEKEQDYLADKKYVVFGWNAKGLKPRTFLFFVEAKELVGRDGISKQEVNRLRDRQLSTVLA
ncbi:hypothetical protein [Biformimicrobium ophioploci]|uniref:Uncharacterized protein n=1 Tax=Biformimicrobium ophioploci TaxID=3036711 RepID=A0ABQ6M398_9GAMM|nr:hypothetical protein [Microbulbifer sp. NKW57]GMG88775.1 hypothetical protein MNKW57_30960 [Microbulbifer sp. NKW57]